MALRRSTALTRSLPRLLPSNTAATTASSPTNSTGVSTTPLSFPPSQSRPHSTVNPSEVSHFNALASSWWDPHGPSRLLHLMNPLRHDFIASCQSSALAQPPARQRYLDIGCGGGIFAESAARMAHVASVTAIDPSPEVLAVARAHARQDPLLCRGWGKEEEEEKEEGAGSGGGSGLRAGSEVKLSYLNTSVERLGAPRTPEEGYDVLALWEVIEHVDYPGPFLEECVKHLKPGGWLVLSTIARTWASWAVTKVVAEDLLRVVPRGTHDWNKYIDEEELRGWFEKKGGWAESRAMGCVYVPGFGWEWVDGGERWGNYFFGIRKEG